MVLLALKRLKVVSWSATVCRMEGNEMMSKKQGVIDATD
jgi:hypothetical protein